MPYPLVQFALYKNFVKKSSQTEFFNEIFKTYVKVQNLNFLLYFLLCENCLAKKWITLLYTDTEALETLVRQNQPISGREMEDKGDQKQLDF